VHDDQSDHSAMTQSWRFTSRPPASQLNGSCWPSAGLHRSVSSTAPSQGLPPPVLFDEICRVRVRLPWQSAEQGEGLGQSPKTQSRSVSHLLDARQLLYSTSEPGAGSPHQVSFTINFRWRRFEPRPQVAEQVPQLSQSAHSPLMQHCGCPLQFTTGTTSWRARGGQSWPPSLGNTSITLWRRLKPTPHMSGDGVQSVHCCHSPQRQSTASPHGWIWQGLISCSAPLQPSRPPGAGCAIDLLRVWVPIPQVFMQMLQPLQAESSQVSGFASRHCSCPQTPLSSRGPLQRKPFPSACASTLRERER